MRRATIERFHRTLADGWAYARCYASEAERRSELDVLGHQVGDSRLVGGLPPRAVW